MHPKCYEVTLLGAEKGFGPNLEHQVVGWLRQEGLERSPAFPRLNSYLTGARGRMVIVYDFPSPFSLADYYALGPENIPGVRDVELDVVGNWIEVTKPSAQELFAEDVTHFQLVANEAVAERGVIPLIICTGMYTPIRRTALYKVNMSRVWAIEQRTKETFLGVPDSNRVGDMLLATMKDLGITLSDEDLDAPGYWEKLQQVSDDLILTSGGSPFALQAIVESCFEVNNYLTRSTPDDILRAVWTGLLFHNDALIDAYFGDRKDIEKQRIKEMLEFTCATRGGNPLSATQLWLDYRAGLHHGHGDVLIYRQYERKYDEGAKQYYDTFGYNGVHPFIKAPFRTGVALEMQLAGEEAARIPRSLGVDITQDKDFEFRDAEKVAEVVQAINNIYTFVSEFARKTDVGEETL